MSQDDLELEDNSAGHEVGQKNSVEIFFNAFERSIRSAKVYAYDSGKDLLSNIYDNVVKALDKALYEDETIDVHVKPHQLIYDRKIVYDNSDKRKSLSFQLHENGIRLLTLKRGLHKDEIIELIQLLATDFSQPDMMDQDLYCAIFERSFDHIEVVGADLVTEAIKKAPEVKDQLLSFENRIKTKVVEKKQATARRLRGDDLKVLEEFHLSSAQFAKSDEEISKIVKNITAHHAGFRQERETLERLILMGFHFLLQEGGGLDQAQVGRDLVVQVSMMVLEQGYFDMFNALVKKIYELHKEHAHQRGEYQKILDQIFHVDNYATFRKVLVNRENQSQVVEILLNGPPSSVRLMALSLPIIPGAYKIFGSFILTHLPEHMSWLMETVETQPDLEAWEHLVNVLGMKPNAQFSKFLTKLVDHAGETMKVKVLRQCAVIGTQESLDIFRKLLKADDIQRRLLALDLLSHAKNRPALMMLKSFVDSPEFNQMSLDEKEVSYRSLIKIAGDACYAWFEQMWFQPGTGIFKSKSQLERRMLLAKAALGSSPNFIKQVMAKNSSDVQPELQELIQRGLKMEGASQ